MKSPKLVIFGVAIAILVVLRFMDFGPMVKLFGDPDTYITKGNAYMAEMDYDSAFKEYDKAILAGENYAKAYAKRGDAYRLLKNYEMSKADYEKALSLDPDCLDALEGVYFLKMFEFAPNPDNFDAYKAEQDKLEAKIMEVCNRLIEKNPNDPDLYLTRARHYSDRDAFRNEIIADHNKAIALAPNDSRLYLSRSYTWQLYKEYDKAIEDVKKALELEPNSGDIYFSYAAIYEDKKEYNKAIELYTQGMALSKKKGGFLSRIGSCYKNMGDIEKAIEYCSKAIEVEPQNGQLYENRAHIYWDLQDYDMALEDFNYALKLNPNDTTIRSAISHIERQKDENFTMSKVKNGHISEEIEGLWVSDTVAFETGFTDRVWHARPISGMPYDLLGKRYYAYGIMIAKDGDKYRVRFVRDEFDILDSRKGNYVQQITDMIDKKDTNFWSYSRKEMRADKNGDVLTMEEPKMGYVRIGNGPEQDISIKLTLVYDSNNKTMKIGNVEETKEGTVIPPEKSYFDYNFSKNHTYKKMSWNEYIMLKKSIWNKGIEKIKSGAPLRS